MRRMLQWIALFVVLTSAHEAAAVTELLKTSAGSLVHWARAEITVGLVPSSSSRTLPLADVVLAIHGATDTWNAVRAGQPRLNYSAEPGADVTIKFCRGRWRGDTIDLGKTQFTASLRNGVVTAASVNLNECDHTFTAPSEGAKSHYDLQAVITHELGHVLGLGHSDTPAAVMHPNGRGAEARKPHADDKTALALIYFGRSRADPDLASTTGSAQAPAEPRPTTARTSVETSSAPGRQTSPGSPGSPGSPAPAGDGAPADPVSVLSLTANSGRQVLVYTCEPTLLPPMGTAPVQDVKRPAGHRARNSVR